MLIHQAHSWQAGYYAKLDGRPRKAPQDARCPVAWLAGYDGRETLPQVDMTAGEYLKIWDAYGRRR